MKRRRFIHTTAAAGLAAAARANPAAAPIKLGKANHCIVLWLTGGMAQIDTFDPKPTMGDPKARKPGSYYPRIGTSVPGVHVCEHLARTAKLFEDITVVRTVHHDVIDEHGAADNRMHTGRPTSGTVQYPSIGSIVSKQRGTGGAAAPAYVLFGYPSTSRGPGFLGSEHSFLYLTDTASGPRGLARPAWLTETRAERRARLLDEARRRNREQHPGSEVIANYDAAIAEAQRLSGPDFMKTFDLGDESDDLRNAYGGEFGQRVLLARRLVESGVRFVEVAHNMNFVNGTGWDTHNEGQLKQHVLIQELDQVLAALITDLKARGKLDDTLIVAGSEFGRPAAFDSGGGRGHHGKAFSVVFAGGSLRHQGAYGVTDALAQKPLEQPVGVADLHATILAALQINPSEYLYDGDRPVPVTDNGVPIAPLFA